MAKFRVEVNNTDQAEYVEADRYEVHHSGALLFITKPDDDQTKTGLIIVDSGEDVVAVFGPSWWTKVTEVKT